MMFDWFEEFWSIYPRKIAKKAARQALAKAISAHEVTLEKAVDAAKAFAASVRGKDIQYIPHPTTWINQGRWDDELPTATISNEYSWKATTGTRISKYQ
jgi:hypothetical protein